MQFSRKPQPLEFPPSQLQPVIRGPHPSPHFPLPLTSNVAQSPWPLVPRSSEPHSHPYGPSLLPSPSICPHPLYLYLPPPSLSLTASTTPHIPRVLASPPHHCRLHQSPQNSKPPHALSDHSLLAWAPSLPPSRSEHSPLPWGPSPGARNKPLRAPGCWPNPSSSSIYKLPAGSCVAGERPKETETARGASSPRRHRFSQMLIYFMEISN